jgi:prophage regulatory protein
MCWLRTYHLHLPVQQKEKRMPLNMPDRLCLDPGSRTIGELMQEREWAVGEIRRLRSDVDRLPHKHEAARIEREISQESSTKHLDPALNAQRLIRLAEVATMLGIGRSTIYKYVIEGTFPAPVKVGFRSVRWKFADVLAWPAKVSE